MANIKSAQKAHRQNLKRRGHNLARKSALKTSVKKLLGALEDIGAVDQAGVAKSAVSHHELDAMLRSVAAQLSRAKSKKVIKRNAASRTLSRLARRVAKASV